MKKVATYIEDRGNLSKYTIYVPESHQSGFLAWLLILSPCALYKGLCPSCFLICFNQFFFIYIYLKTLGWDELATKSSKRRFKDNSWITHLKIIIKKKSWYWYKTLVTFIKKINDEPHLLRWLFARQQPVDVSVIFHGNIFTFFSHSS